MRIPLRLPPADGRAVDLVVVGENSVDLVARVGAEPPVAGRYRLEAVDWFVGGQAATAAVGCARQGHRVRYVGVLGGDANGRAVRQVLEREGVEVASSVAADVPNRTAIVTVVPDGERTIYEYRHPDLAAGDRRWMADRSTDARLLMVDATDLVAATVVADAARAVGVPTIVDVDRVERGTDDLLARGDVIIVPEGFATVYASTASLADGLARLAARSRASVVVATRGRAGATAWCGGEILESAGFDVPAVDTTGAGDAFRAGFCSAWLDLDAEADLGRLLEWANATAAVNCQSAGAQTGLPRREVVAALVTRGGRTGSK